jgi:hypothetical protein
MGLFASRKGAGFSNGCFIGEERKRFFFEKKKQKTFAYEWVRPVASMETAA